MSKTQILVYLVIFLILDTIPLPLPATALMLVYVYLLRPLWFRQIVDRVYAED